VNNSTGPYTLLNGEAERGEEEQNKPGATILKSSIYTIERHGDSDMNKNISKVTQFFFFFETHKGSVSCPA